MLPKLIAINNEWNRRYNFTDENSHGILIDQKNGSCYFGWIDAVGDAKYYHCEQSVFEKRFQVTSEYMEHRIEDKTKIKFLRYPKEH